MRGRLDGAAALVLVALSIAGCSGAKYQRPESRYKVDTGGQTFGPKDQWQEEGGVALAPYPEEKNLQSFEIPGPTENTFLIDTGSLSAGKDGVVRYAIIVRSSTGVDNASFEGIRCETRQWRPYAYGTEDRKWSPARDTQWQRIVWHSTNAYRYALYRDYLCLGGAPVKVSVALAEMRRLKTLPPGRNY